MLLFFDKVFRHEHEPISSTATKLLTLTECHGDACADEDEDVCLFTD